MENQQGWIKFHRKIYKNPWSRDPEWLAVWVYLLAHVAWEPTDVIWEGKRVTIQAGQMTTGRKVISQQTGVSESKVQRVLDCLESEQQIEQQTTPRCRLITIKNWNHYQQSEQQIEQQMNNKRTTNEQQMNTNKEFQEDKELKKERKEGGETPPTPKETMEGFIFDIQNRTDNAKALVFKIAAHYKIQPEKVSAEFDRFLNYWCELTPSGKKQRWQTEKVFEVRRRLATWFSRVGSSGFKSEEKKGIRIIS